MFYLNGGSITLFGWRVLNLGGGSYLSGGSSVLFKWQVCYSVWMGSLVETEGALLG